MKTLIFVIGASIAIALAGIAVLIWLAAFIDESGIDLTKPIDIIADHAERTAKLIKIRREKDEGERVMHYKTDRHINKILIQDELVMEMDVGNSWSVTDVWWDHDIPTSQVDCIKVKFEKVKEDENENL